MNTKSKTILLAALASICLLCTLIQAVSIYPSFRNFEKALNVSSSNTSVFTLRNDYPYDLNVTFEVTASSDYLSSYVTFNPYNATLVRANTSFDFNVTITPTSSLSNGSHLLIFRPRADILKETEENNTDHVMSRGHIVTVSAAAINFVFRDEEEEEPSEPGSSTPTTSSGGGGGGAAPKKIKNLKIEVPVYVKLVEGGASVVITLNNTGDVDLTNLTMNLTSTNKISLDYDRVVGDLKVSRGTTVMVNLSDSTVMRNVVNINVSDSKDSWTAYFVVYSSELAQFLFEKGDCLTIEPIEFTIEAKKKTYLNLTLINLCNISLHDVTVKIDGLDYATEIRTIDESVVIHPDILISEGEHTYKVKAVYAEGKSTKSIIVYSMNYKIMLDKIREHELELKKIRQRLNKIPVVLDRDGLESEINDIENMIEHSKLFIREGKLVDLYVLLSQIQSAETRLMNNLFIQMIMNLGIFLLLSSLPFIALKIIRRMREEEFEELKKKVKFLLPDLEKLPKVKGSAWLGKIAETKKKVYFGVEQLMQHTLVAGATGSGKTVSAMVIVEEVLKKKVPVVVLDPTAEWSGFVKECKDKEMLGHYKEFGMAKGSRRKFGGKVVEIRDPYTDVDFMKMARKGEILVLCLNQLKQKYVDVFTKRFIDNIFASSPKESRKLELLIVSEEVHRFLPKYGGGKAYLALESAIREFRKWGIGILLISQILTDFKGSIRGNIASEVQFRTKYSGDINRVKTKYGATYSSYVSRMPTAVGMFQNPQYNDGKPYFINFRPLLHSPFKLSESERKKNFYVITKPEKEKTYLRKDEAKVEDVQQRGLLKRLGRISRVKLKKPEKPDKEKARIKLKEKAKKPAKLRVKKKAESKPKEKARKKTKPKRPAKPPVRKKEPAKKIKEAMPKKKEKPETIRPKKASKPVMKKKPAEKKVEVKKPKEVPEKKVEKSEPEKKEKPAEVPKEKKKEETAPMETEKKKEKPKKKSEFEELDVLEI